MTVRSDLQILALFSTRPNLVLSIRQIAQALHKPYAFTYHAVQDLLEQGLLGKQVIGRASMCSLNLDHPQAPAYLALVHPVPSIKDLPGLRSVLFRLSQHFPFLILLYHRRKRSLVLLTRDKTAARHASLQNWHITSLTPAEFCSECGIGSSQRIPYIPVFGHDLYCQLLHDHYSKQQPVYALGGRP